MLCNAMGNGAYGSGQITFTKICRPTLFELRGGGGQISRKKTLQHFDGSLVN